MEVTRKNFNDVLETVSDDIKNASFLAVDGEFTGITLQGATSHLFETPEDRYKKLKDTVSQFLLVQFGLATFQYCTDTDRYSVRAYNFYVCPRPFARQAPDQRYLCQSSSIDFLASQGFDFNKLFREGIPFLRRTEEEALRASLTEKHAEIDERLSSQKNSLGIGMFSSPAFSSPSGDSLLPNKGPCAVPEEHQDFINDICTKIENFLNSDQTDLSLEPCNGFLRKLIYQAVAQRFPSGIHLESKTNEKRLRYIEVSKATSEEEMKKKEEEKRRAEFIEVDEAVGFSKVIRMICDSGKPVAGHNMILDLMYIIQQFCCPMPEDYEDFKHLVRSLLPKLVDTKHMASSQPFRTHITSTALADLHKSLQQNPFGIPDLEHPAGFPSYTIHPERYHEAGYDAYVTGLCFIAMANHLGKGKGDRETVLPTSPLVEDFLNKLYLLRMPDVQFMNMSGEDVCPSRDHVFHVTFPKNWKTSDLSQLFAPFGNVQVSWIDDTSAFVALYRHEQADVVIRCLPATDSYRVCTYHEYMIQRSRRPAICTSGAIFETPKQVPGDNKRKPSPMSDIDLPRKKRRSSRESPFASNRSFPTIPEEEEAFGEDSNQTTKKNSAYGTHDLDVSITEHQRKGTKRSASEMFEVPDTW